MKRPPFLLLAILDGWGLSERREGNAIALARTRTMEGLLSRYAWTSLVASGLRVGLPEGQMGNSEVGHLNLGAGRVVYQDITRIDKVIESGEFFQNEVLQKGMETARHNALHLLGLVSDGGVHSHTRHLYALLRFARENGVKRIYVHAFSDGRDTYRQGGLTYLKELQDEMKRLGVGEIASVSGRYYAMDRDNRWDRTEKACRAIVEGKSDQCWADPLQGIRESYDQGVYDEFIVPFAVVDSDGQPAGRIEKDDAVIFFNFRADRARQLTRALTQPDFDGFPTVLPPLRHYVTMTEYDGNFDLPVAFPPFYLEKILVKLFTHHGIPNLRLAETEKYAHVTYFFNGGEEKPFPGEERVLIPSPKVATYDLKPEMSAFEITDRLLHELDRGAFRAVVLNFANADMVGHTGSVPAAVKAVEAVDACLARIHEKVLDIGGIMLVTADHGNAEQMIDPETGNVHTAHTTNPVPCILVDPHYSGKLRPGGTLEDVAPTLLDYLGIDKPQEMTGNSLFLAD